MMVIFMIIIIIIIIIVVYIDMILCDNLCCKMKHSLNVNT